jgi:putative ABC transport system permease protein
MVRSFLHLQGANLGFSPRQVLTLKTPLPRFRYADAGQRVLFYDRVLDELRGLPSVTHVGLVNVLPLSGIAAQVAVRLPGPIGPQGASVPALSRAADADYFQAIGIPLRRGRLFSSQDSTGALPVAVVSESMARRLWPSADALFQTFVVADDPTPVQVVGIVGDVRHWVGADPEPTFYRPYRQMVPDSAAFVLATAGPAMNIASVAEQAIWSIDRDQPITYVRTFDSDVADQMWPQRLSAAVLGMFAIVALAIAATGIFGVMSASVMQRSREIGIRVAIGATPAGIVRMIVIEAAGWIALGIGIGAATTVVMTRYLRSVLYGVTPTDPSTFGVIMVLTTVTAILATYLPARTASRRAPMQALNR